MINIKFCSPEFGESFTDEFQLNSRLWNWAEIFSGDSECVHQQSREAKSLQRLSRERCSFRMKVLHLILHLEIISNQCGVWGAVCSSAASAGWQQQQQGVMEEQKNYSGLKPQIASHNRDVNTHQHERRTEHVQSLQSWRRFPRSAAETRFLKWNLWHQRSYRRKTDGVPHQEPFNSCHLNGKMFIFDDIVLWMKPK